jgi:prepilin-type N-terminal cleavage/methylation domain-containing protein
MTNRRGLTLIELLIAMVVAAIIGTSLVALLVSQSKFSERLTAERDARTAARTPVAILGSELRMVDPDWGIESATTELVVLRIPYALGVFCGTSGSNYIVQLLPTDATLFSAPGHAGYAIRGTGGLFTSYASTTIASTNTTSTCTGATPPVDLLQGASLVSLAEPATPPVTPIPGTPMILYRRIEYSYGAAAATGHRSLFRRVLGVDNTPQEIGGPYTDATAARFSFFLRDTPTVATTTVPADLRTIVGLNVGLPGRAERNPRMAAQTVSSNLSTAFYFTNRRF